MSSEYQMQEKEKPGERDEQENRKGERDEWEKRYMEDFVSDKVSVVADKMKDLQNADLLELAENAKEYARQKPGQALLISAAAGLLLGLIIRGRR
ncbi:MAG TPA: DUF883 C-terminal domain-containing protein [Pyrinomonadaceae bacterium]|nr:DUF883 C-terminal domain-containing protein [Pyrinomonadaceae bacterium]